GEIGRTVLPRETIPLTRRLGMGDGGVRDHMHLVARDIASVVRQRRAGFVTARNVEPGGDQQTKCELDGSCPLPNKRPKAEPLRGPVSAAGGGRTALRVVRNPYAKAARAPVPTPAPSTSGGVHSKIDSNAGSRGEYVPSCGGSVSGRTAEGCDHGARVRARRDSSGRDGA
ncbi:unnamed protein product, partial [Discosporangium mesarthrocarpum]